jgi:hypothetical protein
MFVLMKAGVDRRGQIRSRFRVGLAVALLALAALGTVVGALTLVRMVEWKIPSTPGRDAPRPPPRAQPQRADLARTRTVLPQEVIQASRSRASPGIASQDRKVLDLLSAKEDAKPIAVPVVDPSAAPQTLSDEQVKRTIRRSQPAFESCIDASLRRRRFRGGRIVVSLTVVPSGAVSRAVIEEPTVERSDLGACLRSACKRMVFPRFQGPAFEVQVPLLLAAGE